jgi:hypothetical protein
MRISTLCAVAGSMLSLSLLAGCGGSAGSGKEDVATLKSNGPVSAGPSASGRERPVVRPDEGRAEFDRYVEVFNQCLRDNGVAVGTGEKPQIDSSEKSRAAAEKCEHLYPETWMERERRTNPQFVDLLRQTAQCLRDKGHDVTVGGDPVSIMYGNNTSANRAYDDQVKCERQAFRESVERYNRGG